MSNACPPCCRRFTTRCCASAPAWSRNARACNRLRPGPPPHARLCKVAVIPSCSPAAANLLEEIEQIGLCGGCDRLQGCLARGFLRGQVGDDGGQVGGSERVLLLCQLSGVAVQVGLL